MKNGLCDKQLAVLSAALANVPFDGWSERTLGNAFEAVGVSTAEGRRLFPGGVPDLIDAFALWADTEMRDKLQSDGQTCATLGVGRFVESAVRKRFEGLAEHREAVRRSLGFLAFPTRMGLGFYLNYRTVDLVWKLAGVHSTDFSYYTRRATLGGILAATTLFWLADDSEDSSATWVFLGRRLQGVVRFGQLKGRLKGAASAPRCG